MEFVFKDLINKVSVPLDKKIKQKDYLKYGKYPIIDQGKDYIGGYTNAQDRLIKVDGFFIVFGDHTCNTKLINFDFAPGADGIKVFGAKEFVHSKFLYYVTSYLTYKLKNKGYGRHFQFIEKMKLNVPVLDEQRKIIEYIEESFSKLDKAEETLLKIKSQLEVYKQSVLKEAFEGKLEYKHRKQCNIKFKVAPEKEIKDLPKLPEKWRYVYLRDLGDLARGKSKHRPRNDSRLFENGKYPFIQTGEVKAANNVITEYHKMYGEFGLAQSKLWPKGTLCITIAANIAETAFLGFDACFPDSIVGFTPNKMVNSHYVKYFIEASKIKLWAFAPATAQKNINLSTLENLIVPYCDIVEQEYIVGLIDSKLTIFRSIEDTIEESVVKISSLRQSILKEAFEGKLV